jgi:hypothetical protein
MKVAYIVSSSFSGSTLLSLILNAHPAIGTISEFNAMDDIATNPDFRCSCGAKIRECPFFLRLRDAMRAKGLQFDIDDMDMMLRLSNNDRVDAFLVGRMTRLGSTPADGLRDRLVACLPNHRREKARILERNEALFQTVLDLQKASLFLDANKCPYRMLFLSQRFDVKGVYLYKNGIAGVYSYVKSALRKNTSTNIREITHRWFREQVSISRCLSRLGAGNYIQIAYSDLCNRPAETLDTICRFLEIRQLPLDNFAHAPHHVIGNAMRLGDFSQIKERLDWKENLSDAQFEEYRRTAAGCLPGLRAVNPSMIEHLVI